MTLSPDQEQLAINVVRGIAMDAPRAANSGHSGTAMALAPLAHVLFGRIMRHDPADARWPDRDRFVLSAGHASILLYSYLFLCGYGLERTDLEQFRQWGSATPGHPETHHTRGVEVTTGPLGQGLANAVGMAIAERNLRSRFGDAVCDHHIFAIAGDGCLQEGISHEAASLAGHQGLDRLIVVYDDNHITIDGSTDLSSSDDAGARFVAYGWHVEEVGEIANDLDALEAVVRRVLAVHDRPSLIRLRSHIGWPSAEFTDNPKAHGDPFPPAAIAEVKAQLGLPVDAKFYAPAELVAAYRAHAASRGRDARAAWVDRFQAWPGDHRAWDAAWSGSGLAGWEAKLPTFEIGQKLATRQAIGACFNATVDVVPGLITGAADLTGNTGTRLDGEPNQSRQHPEGRQVHYGIREHAMGAAMVGMAHHGGILPAGGTFFVFSDYMKGAVRLAALSSAKVLFVFTHDSVGVGEDGPTHQPIEQLAALRALPGLRVIRPADANETAAAYRIAVDSDGPTALVLSRQGVPVLDGTAGAPVEKGAYVLSDVPTPGVVLVGTGSEVSLCVAAGAVLRDGGVAARVVSMPSWDLFAAQSEAYRSSVFPRGVPRLSVEAASTFGWARWAEDSIGIDRFGASAPGDVALANLGINVEHVVTRARALAEQGGAR